MFASVNPAAPDAILGLVEKFRQDPNPEKINLTAGVFVDREGVTPIMECVKRAEQKLVENETTKTYPGIAGIKAYNDISAQLLFGEEHSVLRDNRSCTVQTVGGTGALRVSADLIKTITGSQSVWFSKPTWANHIPIYKSAGLDIHQYEYLDSSGTRLDFDRMLDSLNQIPNGDAVLFHACCHNPTGVDPSQEQWNMIQQVVETRNLFPIFDAAYQGLGNSLDEDAAIVRQFASTGREMLVCRSFSKNLGLYGERVGSLTAICEKSDQVADLASVIKFVIRANYSNPPIHGASIVDTVLSDSELNSLWRSELDEMRNDIANSRQLFAKTLAEKVPDHDFSHINDQIGMFSYSGLTRDQVDRLIKEHAIYIVGDGRINIAGIREHNVERLCECIGRVISQSAALTQ